MPQRTLKGINQKIVYRNERYTKGTVTTDDPLYEGSFRRLINFKVSNQNSSLQNRDPFITVPLYNLNNEEVKISENSHVFFLNEDTEHAFILDMQQTINNEIKMKEMKPIHTITYEPISDVQGKWIETVEIITKKTNVVDGKEVITYETSYEYREISLRVVDGDTINISGKRYRLAIIDAPELEDVSFDPEDKYDRDTNPNGFTTRGQEAKKELEKILKGLGTFRVSQFDFQSDKVDQFGRPMVFILTDDRVVNIEMLSNGFAGIYGIEKFSIDRFSIGKDENFITFKVPQNIKFINHGEDDYFEFQDAMTSAYKNSISNDFSPTNKKYFDYRPNFQPIINPIYKTKPVVHKIEKDTNLEKIKLMDEEGNFTEEKIIKRVIKTFEINELPVKTDLELFTEESLEYQLVKDDFGRSDFSLTISKYQDQYLNFLVRIYDSSGDHIYTGLAELSRTSPNPEEGIFETFSLRTYKKPEVHVELQDQTNFKPNILDDSSILPVKLEGKQANVRGISNPKVDTVLLRTIVNRDLGEEKGDVEASFIKYFKTNTLVYDRFKNNSQIEAIFKTPFIRSNNKEGRKKYMYRWDLISAKEIDVGNKTEIENFNPYFRSAWTELKEDGTPGENLSTNSDRITNSALSIEDSKIATKYLVIEREVEALKNEDTQFVSKELGKSKIDNGDPEKDILYKLDDEIKTFINNTTIEDLKKLFTKGTDSSIVSFKIEGKSYTIRDLFNDKVVREEISERDKDDEIGITVSKETNRQTYGQVNKTFEEVKEQKGRLSFIFLPYRVAVTDKDDNEKTFFISSQVQTITFNLEDDRSISLPPMINVSEDIFGNEELKKIIERKTTVNVNRDDRETFQVTMDQFFQDGFVAVFYLATYDDVKDLKYDDVFYDQTAYKKTSAVYTFKDSNFNSYNPSDFIRDRLQTESYALRYSKYIGKFDDMTVLYGNPRYRNTIFLSEPGSPYYFGLVNAFEFDAEVVHVNQFKDILMVFTTNDIWVLYWFEDRIQMQDAEGKYYEQINMVIRQKKILYNVSTEHKNKNSIKNLTRYVTLVSNNVLYLITPSSYIADDTQFSLRILSQNIEHLVQDPIYYINERLSYFGIKEVVKDYKFNLIATDNSIKLYYSVEAGLNPYTLVVTYDVLNNRWYEEDTITFGHPEQIYLLDSTTGYEMLTSQNNQLFLTYQTDKYKNILMDEYGQSYYDLSPIGQEQHSIKYFIDTGYLKLTEHLRKRFRQLLINIKNIDSKELGFTYDFTIDDIQHVSDFELEYSTNNNNEIVEINKLKNTKILSTKQSVEELMDALGVSKIVKEEIINNTGFLDNFILDFSNLSSSDIMMVRHNLIGRGRIPRVKMGFSATNRFYILSFGIVYTEKGGR